MSAMLEAYDMPMLEYQADLDIQMQPSSSDQWLPEESHMEEDTPAIHMKTENYSSPKPDDHLHMKPDVYAHEKPEVTIEVDMEPFPDHQNNEYEMQEDEPVLLESLTDAQDVEVYDVPLAQSPFIIPSLSVPQSIPSTFSSHFDHTASSHHISASPLLTQNSRSPVAETYDLDITPLDHIPTSVDAQPAIHEVHDVSFETHDEVHNVSTEVDEVHPETHEVHGAHPEVHEAHDIQSEVNGAHGVLPENLEIHVLPQAELQEHVQSEPPGSLNVPENEEISQETFLEAHTHNLEQTLGDQNRVPETSECLKPPEPESDIHENEIIDKPESDDHPSVNDPHEISEGVYIDPPPPVLLSVASADRFDFSFFNESPEWAPSHPSGVVFLRHLPTLYYEPLSAVFEALHEEEYLQSLFHLPESELVLDAVDLQLTISEDNVYAREVTLHDLNVLHDVSGTHGLLRMRLYAPAPRFIIRYQHLQEQVSRSNVDQSTVEPSSALDDSKTNEHHEIPQEQTEEEDLKTANQNFDNGEVSHGVGHLLNPDVQEEDGRETSIDLSHTPRSQGQGPGIPLSEGLPENDENDDHSEGSKNEGETVVEIHDSDPYPPLPAEYEEEEEEEEEEEDDTDPTRANVESDENVAPEGASGEPTASSELGFPVEDPGHSETYHEEEAGEGGEAEEAEDYGYADENHALGQEDAHPERSLENHLYAHDADEESGQTESLNEEEEYVEDAVKPGEQDTISHSTNDDIEYAQEETDHAFEEDSFETSAEDFEYSHPDDGIPSADLESLEGQALAHGDPGVDYDSVPDFNEEHNETEVSADLDNFVNLEGNTELEPENVWESSIDHTGQETYDWEEGLDDENHDTQSDKQNEKLATNSSHSSVTLSSKTSKRSFDELEVDEEFEDESGHWSPPSSPDPKRSRIQ